MDKRQDTQMNSAHTGPESWIWVALAWFAVGTPLAWGIWQTLKSAIKLFG